MAREQDRVNDPRSTWTAPDYRAVFVAAPDGIVIVDAEGRILDLNPQMESLFNYSREELLGESVELLVPDQLQDSHQIERDAYMKSPRSRPMGIGLELRGRRKDGSEVPVEISLSPMPIEGGQFVIAVVRDMTERSRLRAFGVSALQAAEEERMRIARELHDDTAQRLAAMLIRLRVLRGIEGTDRRTELMDELHKEVHETADAVRRIARGLRPPSLEEMGLEAGIRSLARTIRETHGLPVEIEVDPGLAGTRLRPDAELALYRIVQEALSNVVRHAGASSARVALEESDQRIVILVEDDGRGFEPRTETDLRGRGLGLLGMRERARYLKGRVAVESAPGEGARIKVEIPRAGGETTGPDRSTRPSDRPESATV